MEEIGMSGRSRKTNIKKAYAKIKDTLTVKEQAAIETALAEIITQKG